MSEQQETLPIKPRGFRVNETEHWSDDVQEFAGKIWTYWVYDANYGAHLCELAVSRDCRYVYYTTEKQITDEQDKIICNGIAEADQYQKYHHAAYIDNNSVCLDIYGDVDNPFETIDDVQEYHSSNHCIDDAYFDAKKEEICH
jgi:hypothetical protein